MPYISESDRAQFTVLAKPAQTVGQLTYQLSVLAWQFKKRSGILRFVTIALVMGAFFCAALEFYRRVAAPYENAKMAENGDVYSE